MVKFRQVRNQLGINVIAKNNETKDFLKAVAVEKTFVKEGSIFRQTPEGTKYLGTINEAWKELERVSDILR